MTGRLRSNALAFSAFAAPLFAFCGSAQGQAVRFTSVNNNFTDASYSMGWEFNVNEELEVFSLGFYDDLQNGLTQSHEVGIFDSAGALLVSTTVSNADPLDGLFRYHPVMPVLLGVGNGYRIAAVTGSENYTWNPNGFSVDPRITFVTDRWLPFQNSLVFPTRTDGRTGYFGPNFNGVAAPVPAPGALAAGVVGAVPGVFLLLRRRRKA